ncbi:MAG: hypothetical protein ABI467_07605 [Kofleriaceae bacterium]
MFGTLEVELQDALERGSQRQVAERDLGTAALVELRERIARLDAANGSELASEEVVSHLRELNQIIGAERA